MIYMCMVCMCVLYFCGIYVLYLWLLELLPSGNPSFAEGKGSWKQEYPNPRCLKVWVIMMKALKL